MISYKKLDVWIYSMETVKQIYTLTMSRNGWNYHPRFIQSVA